MRLRNVFAVSVLALALPVAASATDLYHDGTFLPNGNKFGDIYTVSLDNGVFEATTDFSQTTIDSQLFVFDSTWHGVVSDDDFAGSTYASTSKISKYLLAGIYYVIVSQFNAEPQAGWLQPIFPDQQYQADAISGSGAYNGSWDPSSPVSTDGDYRLKLSGDFARDFHLDDPVAAEVAAPEPASLTLFGTGLVGMVAGIRRRRRNG